MIRVAAIPVARWHAHANRGRASRDTEGFHPPDHPALSGKSPRLKKPLPASHPPPLPPAIEAARHRRATAGGARVLLASARSHRVRLSGQDTDAARSRSAFLRSTRRTSPLRPVNHLRARAGAFRCDQFDALEDAVVGFVTATPLAEPKQAHSVGSQVVRTSPPGNSPLRSFVSSGERNLLRMSGLCACCRTALRMAGAGTFLARLDRFLPMSPRNYAGCQRTTPANYLPHPRRQLNATSASRLS